MLDGHSLVYYSSWMDQVRNTDEYRHTSSWHYRNVDKGETPQTMPKNPDGDAVVATAQMVELLKSGTLSAKDEKVALMMLIHLVGDMHCPMHAGRLSDLGGNRRKITFFGEETNLHSIWDSSMLEAAHKWSYTEWQQQIDILSAEEKAEIVKGTPDDWFEVSHQAAVKAYAGAPEGSDLSYDYVDEHTPLLEQQLLYGGLRLAYLLNEIYK